MNNCIDLTNITAKELLEKLEKIRKKKPVFIYYPGSTLYVYDENDYVDFSFVAVKQEDENSRELFPLKFTNNTIGGLIETLSQVEGNKKIFVEEKNGGQMLISFNYVIIFR